MMRHDADAPRGRAHCIAPLYHEMQIAVAIRLASCRTARRRGPSPGLFVFLMSAVLTLGMCWGVVIYGWTTEGEANTVVPLLFGGSETVRVKTTPKRILLEVVSHKEWSRYGPVSGVAYYRRGPCHIVIPEGWLIDVQPVRQRARLVDDENTDTLIHEILHCYYGGWHG